MYITGQEMPKRQTSAQKNWRRKNNGRKSTHTRTNDKRGIHMHTECTLLFLHNTMTALLLNWYSACAEDFSWKNIKAF